MRVRLLKEPFPSARPRRGAFLIVGLFVGFTDDIVSTVDRRRIRLKRVIHLYWDFVVCTLRDAVRQRRGPNMAWMSQQPVIYSLYIVILVVHDTYLAFFKFLIRNRYFEPNSTFVRKYVDSIHKHTLTSPPSTPCTNPSCFYTRTTFNTQLTSGLFKVHKLTF